MHMTTKPLTVRVDVGQLRKLQSRIRLAHKARVTDSVIVRALLQAMEDGLVPDEYILAEAARSAAAVKQGQHALKHRAA